MTRRHPARRAAALAIAIVAAAALARDTGAAQPPAAGAPLAQRLQSLVDAAALGDRVGIAVVDTRTGQTIFNHHGDLPLNPASNMKLVTAAAALADLGAEFTMLTGLYGTVAPDGSVPVLALKGLGDPTLRMSDLVELAVQLGDRGVRRVDSIVVDGTYFDDRILPPAFDQQPNEVASFRAAIGAVSVEENAFVLRVIPGDTAGAAARVRLAAEGYFQVDNRITTSAGGAPNVIADQRPRSDGRLDLILRGSVPAGVLGVSYRRRVEHPLWHAGYAMADALERAGIRGRREVRIGAMPNGLPLLTSRRSEPLAEILGDVGKWSDNFVAEMVLKVLGAERARPGTSERGVEALQGMLERAGVPRGQATIVNGSGLFQGNQIAASHLAKLLAFVYRDPALRPEYVAQLAVGGVDGTLGNRLSEVLPRRIVRAKTGTLDDVIALSGYVLGPEPNSAIAFSVLCNGIRGKQGAARQLADDVARAIAAHLHPPAR